MQLVLQSNRGKVLHTLHDPNDKALTNAVAVKYQGKTFYYYGMHDQSVPIYRMGNAVVDLTRTALPTVLSRKERRSQGSVLSATIATTNHN